MQRSASLWISGSAVALVALVAGLGGLTSCTAKQPEGGAPAGTAATPAAMTPEQKIARGRYLVQMGSCTDCHTPGTLYGQPDTTRLLSGSELGWHGPWGTSYPRNLTPDMETGIGKYSEDDIVNVLKKGIRPGGVPVLPPMPWPNLVHLTDEDAYAIAAYLKSLPPVSHKVPAALPPGKPGPTVIEFPPPPAWDVPKGPAPAGK